MNYTTYGTNTTTINDSVSSTTAVANGNNPSLNCTSYTIVIDGNTPYSARLKRTTYVASTTVVDDSTLSTTSGTSISKSNAII